MKNLSEYLQKYPQRTTAIFGVNIEQLHQLIEALKSHEAERLKVEGQYSTVNPKGAGRHAKLSVDEQMYLCLLYLRHHPTFEILGLMFEVSKTTAHEVFEFWLDALRELLPGSLLEEYLDDEEAWDIVEEVLEQDVLIVDSTEQRRERPKDYEAQKQCYSGKQKQHTFKSQVITNRDGSEIVDVIAGVPGPSADVNLLRHQQPRLSEEQRYSADKAYIGAQRTCTPHKKPKGKEFSDEQIAENKERSRQRIFVEHLIGKLKVFRVLQERFRLRPQKYRLIFLTICGLVRFKLGRIELGFSS
jgi:hypothetical protein